MLFQPLLQSFKKNLMKSIIDHKRFQIYMILNSNVKVL